MKCFSNIIGFDDGPFHKGHPGKVLLVGAVFARERFEGALVGSITRDGDDAGERIAAMIRGSRYREHIQLVMLQGITFGGFNVVDMPWLHRELELPVIAVARKRPDMEAFRMALVHKVAGGTRKWQMVKKLARMASAGKVYYQQEGLPSAQAAATIEQFAIHSHIPEPIRTAHLIAGAVVDGQSRGAP